MHSWLTLKESEEREEDREGDKKDESDTHQMRCLSRSSCGREANFSVFLPFFPFFFSEKKSVFFLPLFFFTWYSFLSFLFFVFIVFESFERIQRKETKDNCCLFSVSCFLTLFFLSWMSWFPFYSVSFFSSSSSPASHLTLTLTLKHKENNTWQENGLRKEKKHANPVSTSVRSSSSGPLILKGLLSYQ